MVGYDAFLLWTSSYLKTVTSKGLPALNTLPACGLELLLGHAAFPALCVLTYEEDRGICEGLARAPEQLGESFVIMQAEEPKEYEIYPILAHIAVHKSMMTIDYTTGALSILEQELRRLPPRKPAEQTMFDFLDSTGTSVG